MIIQYNIVVTIINLVDNVTKRFCKTINDEIEATTDGLLYNNYHVLSNGIYILDIFTEEVNAYCIEQGIESSSVEVDEFEIVSLTDRVDVFFESPESADNSLSLRPIIKAYVYPKHDELKIPNLVGVAYDDTTIIWSWPEDEMYAHYLIEEPINPEDESMRNKVIAQIPIGMSSYTETGLQPDTPYTRRLINYTDEQTSVPSASVTVKTETVEIEQSLREYNVAKNYDFTTKDSERKIIEENLSAFHSGVGDFNDLKVYKQMDVDFYQNFKAYLEISGRRFEREKRYEQVNFNYKICLDAIEEVEEQEGEVTFDVEAYPREWIAVEDYMWGTSPVIIKTRLKATVFLRKPIESEETIEQKLYKPKFRPRYEMVTILNETSLILSLDCSTSQRKIIGTNAETGDDITRRDNMVTAAKLLIDKFEAIAPNQLEYVIVAWAGNSHVKVFSPGQAVQAKQSLDSIDIRNGVSKYDGVSLISGGDVTHFEAGLTAGYSHCSYPKVGQIFFTDGFCNYGNGTKAWGRYPSIGGNWTDSKCDTVISSIREGFNNAQIKTFVVFGAKPNEYDPDLEYFGNHAYGAANLAFQQEIFNLVTTQITSDNYFGYTQASIDENSAIELADKLSEGIDMFGQEEQLVGYDFVGWEEYEVEAPPIVKYNLDDVKQVTVETEVYSFAFLHDESQVNQIPDGIPYGITPAKYVRKEKRAIVPESSFLEKTAITSDNLYNILLELVKETPEWQNGYNETIGTVEEDGEPDKFLIANLYIQDTYNFADEDDITEDNWGTGTYEDGMEGSINVFTEINKMTIGYYGDDCYLIEDSDKSKLFIQGYTDALLYDYTTYMREELNKYDRESETLSGPSVTDLSLVLNRKKPTLSYLSAGGISPLNHVLDLVEKDDDIWIENYSSILTKAGSYIEIGSMVEDLIAHNDTCFESPVLNYRFNIEDPDAKVCLYEIIPTSKPKSDYLHIVILHVYYAKNVWITDKTNYHGDPESWMNLLARKGDQCLGIVGLDAQGRNILEEGLYQWTQKEWQHGAGKDNCWYIDECLWFMAKSMIKIQEYYDELPGVGLETFFGSVNGRFLTDTPSGRKDLIVQVPRFNIPTTVTDKHSDSIRIYAIITEIIPDSSMVSYKWEHPLSNINGITQTNGDYICFTSDNIEYKDIEYIDVVSTINLENQEVFDNKITEKTYHIKKPNSFHEYENYYLNVITDNSDVIPMRYPTEIDFQDGYADIGVSFKGVINATSKWSPRIHNGYYYLNQHEYFAYSQFDVDANFDTYSSETYKTLKGYVNIEVNLLKPAEGQKNYTVNKSTRPELLHDENKFTWVNEKGLTLKPIIDGEYYKEYNTYYYISPKITFDTVLTKAKALTVSFDFSELSIPSLYIPMQIRSYDTNNCIWTDWKPFVNGDVPDTLSNAYQVRFILEPEVLSSDIVIEDYKCCYLDWKDDESEYLTNIVTVTDFMTTGPNDAMGTYISKVFDYGCQSSLLFDIYESNYNEKVKLYIAYGESKEMLMFENIVWTDITDKTDIAFMARYFRYKLEIPANEKVYWLHQKITTKKSIVALPYVTKISMEGIYFPESEKANFINTEAFEISKNGTYHKIIPNLLNFIGADVLSRGYEYSHIERVSVSCVSSDIRLNYSDTINALYPTEEDLSYSIFAISEIDRVFMINKTPYIRIDEKDEVQELDVITIRRGTPQQYCPITIEDENGNTYSELFDCDENLYITDTYTMDKSEKYIEMYRNDYDINTIRIYINDKEMLSSFKIVNHLLIFDNFLNIGDIVTVTYRICHTFYSIIDRENDTTKLIIYNDTKSSQNERYKVYFETGKINNKFIANDLSLNPMYRTDYKGFIYLTDEHNEPYKVNIYCNPLRLKAGGYDKVDIQIEVLDIQDNPVIAKTVAVDCNCGIITCKDYVTDMNGVIHLIYESSVLPAKDILKARVETEHNTVIEQSICIINE